MTLERHWQRRTLLAALLYPLSVLFRAVVALRRAAFASGVLASTRLPVPVIVVGNITVGGTGKTPLVLWLVHFLAERGLRPGVVSRGYGASAREPLPVSAASDPARFGDEPVLLARRGGCPVWIGADRVAAARALLGAHPECNVIVSDDGLQHYRLRRDGEIAVIDGARGLGNGWMLPAGPLREPPWRLSSVDAVVVNGSGEPPAPARRTLRMALVGREFRNLLDPQRTLDAAHFHGKRVHAVAGIGNPQRFFEHLRALGIDFEAHAFPDHHRYVPSDLAFAGADTVLMTEKDAVKCAAFASERQWALRVDAVPDRELGELVLKQLER